MGSEREKGQFARVASDARPAKIRCASCRFARAYAFCPFRVSYADA